MPNHFDSFLSKVQQVRCNIHQSVGPTNFIQDSGLRKFLEDHAEDIDTYFAIVGGVVVAHRLATVGAAAGPVGVVIGAGTGFKIGYSLVKGKTRRVQDWLKKTLDDAAEWENSRNANL